MRRSEKTGAGQTRGAAGKRSFNALGRPGGLYPMTLMAGLLAAMLLLTACAPAQPAHTFEAVVIENQSTLLVEPAGDGPERASADRIAVHTGDAVMQNSGGENIALSDIRPRARVEITYDGRIAESYPAQIWAEKIIVIEEE